jgi:hypothetical protein
MSVCIIKLRLQRYVNEMNGLCKNSTFLLAQAVGRIASKILESLAGNYFSMTE